jgi:hypothetical protein
MLRYGLLLDSSENSRKGLAVTQKVFWQGNSRTTFELLHFSTHEVLPLNHVVEEAACS